MPKIKIDLNTHDLMLGTMHGRHSKSLLVLHETVSSDQRGLDDISNVEDYLAKIGYGIHGMTDLEAHKAWAVNLGNAIFYHCGGVNEQSIGIEQVFMPLADIAKDKLLWAARQPQLRATAQLCAGACRTFDIPMQYSDSRVPGITSHWDVSQFHSQSLGHSDCRPIHKGGYYPILQVVQLTKIYYKLGYRF